MSFHHRMEGADLHPPSRRFVENNTASSIPFLRAVTFDGFGVRPAVTIADGGADIVRGVTASVLAASTTGVIVQIGILKKLDTTAFAAGDILYADASGVLSTTPNGAAIAEVLEIGASTGVIYVDSTGGGINSSVTNTDQFVKVTAVDTTTKYLSSAISAGTGLSSSILSPGANETLEFSLDAVTGDLNDVSASTPVANDLLIFSSAAGTYVPRTLTAGSNIGVTVNASQIVISASGGGTSSVSVLGQLTDVSTLPRTDGVVMHYNASATEFQFDKLRIIRVNGEQVLSLVDDTRGDKVLSVETMPLAFGRGKINNNDWIRQVDVKDAESGYIAPYDGTVIRATAHCADTDGNTQTFDLYVGTTSASTIGTITSASTQAQFNNVLNVDFLQSDRLRLRGGASAAGAIQDTEIVLYVKWR